MRKPIISKIVISSRKRAIKRADAARDRRDPVQAAILYRSVIEREGPTFGILVQLGNALKDSGAFEEAEQTYRLALAIKPDDADCHLQLGHLMKLSGRTEQALDLYIEASRLDPNLSSAIEEINAIRTNLVQDFVEPPSYIGLLSNIAVSDKDRADAARDRRDPVQAAILYRSVIEREGPTFGILVQLGNALKDSGAFEEAEQTYRLALAIKPDDADCHLQLGHLMKLSGRTEQALDLYIEASRLDPNLSSAIEEINTIRTSYTQEFSKQSSQREYVSNTVASDDDKYSNVTDVVFKYDCRLDYGGFIIYNRIMNSLKWRRN